MTKPMSRTSGRPGAAPRTSPGRPGRRRWGALAAVAASFLVVGLDSYIVVTALPTFSAKLGASESQLQWITAAYTLAGAGLMLPVGQLGDRLGRRKVLLASLVLFGVASAAASRVTGADELIALRAVMGAGGAAIMPMGQAIIPMLFPAEAERRRAVAVTTIAALVSMPLGPLLGGWMLSHFAWGWIFLINVPVTGLAVLGVWLLVPESRDPADPRLDWPGALLSAAGVTAVVYAIIEEPAVGWHGPVLAGLLAGAVMTGLFVLRQRTAASPLVDLRLLRDRLFGWGTAAFAVISFAMTGVLFVLTPYLQSVQGNDAQGTGLRLLPMIGALIAAAAHSPGLAARLGLRLVIGAGLIVSAAGLAILTRAGAGSGYGVVALALSVFGAGLGLGLPLAADAVLGALAPGQQGMGNALSRTLQRVGVALGAAVLGAVLNGVYRDSLSGHLAGVPAPARGAAAASIAGAHAVAARLAGAAAGPLAEAANAAYTHGMADAAAAGAGVLLLCAILCLAFLPGRRSSRPAG